MADAPLGDAELVLAATAGDKDAFGALYSRYAPRIYDFLFSILRDRDRAADVLQDTFLTAGARLHQLADPGKVRPWLYAVARHEAFRVVKKVSRETGLDEASMIASSDDPARSASQRELSELVRDATASLGPRDRTLFELHFRHGLEGRELADAMGVSAGNVYVMVNRLRGQLERSLGALLVSRLGRKDCPGLNQLLSGWDGRFTRKIRKSVARHVETCEVCSELRKKTLTPQAMLGILPFVPVPDADAAELLEKVELVSARGPQWTHEPGGFPPPAPAGRRRSTNWLAAAAVIFLAMALTVPGPALEKLDQLVGNRPVPTGPIVNKDAGRGGPMEETPAPPPAPLVLEPVETEPSIVLPGGPRVTEPEKSPSAGGKALPPRDPGPSAAPVPGGDDRPAPEAPLQPADTAGPSLGELNVQPRTVRANTRCSSTLPSTASVSIPASDESGVDSVIVHWSGPAAGSGNMSGAGGKYSATLGPFQILSIGPGESAVLELNVVATDRQGNRASRTGSLILACPAPGAPAA